MIVRSVLRFNDALHGSKASLEVGYPNTSPATCPAGTLGSVISTDCDLGAQGKTLAINGQSGDSYTCTFEAAVAIDGLAHTDKATGTLSDNDGNSISSTEGTATVTITTSHNP